MNARIADLHRQAERDQLAQAARRARCMHYEQVRGTVGSRPATVLARCLHAVLAAGPVRPPAGGLTIIRTHHGYPCAAFRKMT